ncbi:MAG: hypothetical protein AAFY59_01410 [Pseudomonadota bacterium]
MSLTAIAPRTRPLPLRALSALTTFALGTLATLSPLTAIILLGWLMRVMRHRTLTARGHAPAHPPRWITGPPGSGWLARPLGGLAANIRTGLSATLSLALATLPFSVLWLTSWWAGWENSFNKGYEQAAIGPLTGLLGVAVFATIMIYLPMALAHQAAEARAFALFELRRVRSATAHAGWGLAALAAATLILAFPLFAARGLPVFAEGIAPRVAEMTSAELAGLKDTIRLATGAYLFLSCLFLKRWSAGLYARAVLRAQAGRDAALWNGAPSTARRPHGHLIRLPLLFAIWVGFAFLIFVGQFLNHAWVAWVTHPLVFLPWVV